VKIEILHVRDPDDYCSLRVWLDGVEQPGQDYVDVDPGRGYTILDWEEAQGAEGLVEGRSPAFQRAVDAAFDDAKDSKFIEK
jgi:hypothetical protein